MKTMMLLGLLISGSAMAHDPLKEVVVKEFLAAQSDGGVAAESRQQLERQGFIRLGETEAVILSGQCGFAGCDATFLVTTSYESRYANTSTRVVAGVVSYGAAGRNARVVKVLEQNDLEALTER